MLDTMPKIFSSVAEKFPLVACQMEKNKKGTFLPTTYSEAFDNILSLMLALETLGIRKGDNVGLMSDNRSAWLWADIAILSLGAADVPRGRDSTAEEISYILKTVDAEVSFVENKDLLKKILQKRNEIPTLKTLILMDDERPEGIGELEKEHSLSILFLSDLLEKNRDEARKEKDRLLKNLNEQHGDDTATIIFTSGTTGEPKGVMLTHNNFITQLKCIPEQGIDIRPGQRWLNVLPVWHSFERLIQYVSVNEAMTLCYSKPIGKIMLADIQKVNPNYFSSVPRIWETIKNGVYAAMDKEGGFKKVMFNIAMKVGGAYMYFDDMVKDLNPHYRKEGKLKNRLAYVPKLLLQPFYALFSSLVFSQVKKKLGSSFSLGISGGGSLSTSIENFFHIVGIRVINGYGMTETAPVLSLQYYAHPVKYTMRPLACTIELRDENGKVCKPGEKGVLYAKGGQVMKGYYKRPELTKRIIGEDGFINTGDLAVMTTDGLVSIVGRAKDTIVLSGGENVEPVPIEAKLNDSVYIETAVVVGQDKKYLSALLVPNMKEIERYLKDNKVFYVSREGMLEMDEVKELISSEINRLVSKETGFKSFELINRFAFLPKPFEVNVELSAKQELKRFKIQELYQDKIESCYR